MRRGDVVIVRQRGVYEGKPRPAVVIQANELLIDHPSILVCLIASDVLTEEAFYRLPIGPTPANGLANSSTILVDKIVSIRRENLGKVVGRIEPTIIGRLDTALALFQGLI